VCSKELTSKILSSTFRWQSILRFIFRGKLFSVTPGKLSLSAVFYARP
jgi:hypothetical protein